MYSSYNNNSYPPHFPSDSPPRKPSPYNASQPVNVNLSDNIDRANIMRTPSPTPSEQKELRSGAIDWQALMNWRYWFRREWLWYYVILTIILVITALVTIYHEQIVHWLTPVTRWLHDLKFGWLVPIGVLFVISFPPLFGHEIVAILCGLVWGLWIGFGIVSAGTFLGEVGNFYAFKYICSARGEKLERSKISYACLAKVVRDGGFWIALVARYSAIPGHFTTAVFSTCGMGIIVFSIAAVLSMPKQLITVYLGVILEQASDGQEDNKSKIISRVVLALTVLVTVVAMWYILRKMNQVKPQIIYERRKARQAKLARTASIYGNDSQMFTGTNNSLTDIPLAPQPKKNQGQPYPFAAEYQRSSTSTPSTPVRGGTGYGGYDSAENTVYAKHSGEAEAGTGHVAPGAGVGYGGYGYTPTRQDSDEDRMGMGAQQEEYIRRHREGGRKPTFPPPGISNSVPTRVLTQSPDGMAGYGHQHSQPQPLAQSQSAPVHSSYHNPTSLTQSQSQASQQPYSSSNLGLGGYPSSQSYPSPTHSFPTQTQNQYQYSSNSSYNPYPETREVAQTPTSASLPTPSYPTFGVGASQSAGAGVGGATSYNPTSFNPYNNPYTPTTSTPRVGGGGHVIEPTDASFHTAIDHGPTREPTREPSLLESELHAPGAFSTRTERTYSPPPPSYATAPGRF